MRTEVKVALVIGMVVLGGGILFVVNQSRKAGKDVNDVVPMHKTTTPAPTPTEKPKTLPGTAPRALVPTGPTGPMRGPVTAVTRTPLPVSPAAKPAPGAEAAPRPARAPAPVVLPPRVEPAAEPEEGPQPTGPSSPAAPTPAPRPATPGVAVPPPPPEAKPTGPTGPAGTPPVRPPERPTERPAPELSAVRKHTVAEGDTLSSLAEEYLGDRNLWPRIKAANPDLTNPDVLLVGQVLIIPPKEGPLPAPTAQPTRPAGQTEKLPAAKPGEPEKPAAAKPGAEKPRNAKPAGEAAETKPQTKVRTYKVAPGDSLVKIARTLLKDPNRWREIYELNKSKIPNPDVLPVGVELRLPEK